jgi:DNA-binding NtrC family response regulator
VLVVDTDPGTCWAIEKGLTRTGYVVSTASTAEQAIHGVHQDAVAAIFMEIRSEAGLTFDLLSRLMLAAGRASVVCTSVDSRPYLVSESMRRGAVGFLVKPFSLAEVRAELDRVIDRSLVEGAPSFPGTQEEDSGYADSLLVGVSSAMQELRATIRQVAQTDLNCLIRGESGVGKDLVSREIHRLSRRRDFPFVKVNCSTLPGQLLESELFGFEKGAFTGATVSKPGRFGVAAKGIIFLDEISELHRSLQAKLLQVIEHKEFTRLGARHSTKVDVQIIVATNADIDRLTKEKAFREDLLFRLNELTIWVPPLSERKEDIPCLVHHFIQKYRGGKKESMLELSPEQMAGLCEQPWPGNVRELENVVKRWIVFGELHARSEPSTASSHPRVRNNDRTPVEEAENHRILKVLEEVQWNRRKAAEVLGISYQTLRRRILRHKLDSLSEMR